MEFLEKNQKMMIVTGVFVLFYLMMGLIPFPFLDMDLLKEFYSRGRSSYFLTVFDRLSLHVFNIYSYLSAAVIVLIISFFNQSWKKDLLDEPAGTDRLEKIILITMVLLSFGKSYAIVHWVDGFYVKGIHVLVMNLPIAYVCYGLLGAGITLLLVYFARWITSFGFMNGLFLIFGLNIIIELVRQVFAFKTFINQGMFVIFSFFILYFFMKYDRYAEKKTLPPHALGVFPFTIVLVCATLIKSFFLHHWSEIPVVFDIILIAVLSFFVGWFIAFLMIDSEKKRSLHVRTFNIKDPLWQLILVSATFSVMIHVPVWLNLSPIVKRVVQHIPSIVILGMILNDIVRNFKVMALIRDDKIGYVLLSHFSIANEANGLVDELGKNGVQAVIINTRPFSVLGMRLPWSLCAPRVPYLVMHRTLGGGSVRVFVRNNDKEKAAGIMQYLAR